MKRILLYFAFSVTAILFYWRFPLIEIYAADEDSRLLYLLRVDEKMPPYIEPNESMYTQNDIVYCTGESDAARANNRAAKFMEEGDFKSAESVLLKVLSHAPLFFPFRYNIGLCYIHLNRLKMALLNLKKAVNLLPKFHKTYLQIGYIYERQQKNDIAISYYRMALKKNQRAYEVYILIGDIYLNRNQLAMAERYYKASLEIASKTPNALLGKAKIHFKRKEYYKAIIIIKYISLDAGYDRSLHYYYAECAYKLRDYKTAYEQYSALLKYRSDKFFLTNSTALIKHKLDLCRRFIEVE